MQQLCKDQALQAPRASLLVNLILLLTLEWIYHQLSKMNTSGDNFSG